jgi:hypothetical protein
MTVSPSININILQGADFSETFLSKESDGSSSSLSGYSGYAQMKKHSTAIVSNSFNVGIVSAIGEVTITMPANQTSQLTPGRYYYDVKLVSGIGEVSRLVEGMAFVHAGITTA